MRRRDLSEEERALWRQAVRDVAAAKRARPAVAKAAPKTAARKRASAPPILPVAPPSRKGHAILGGGDPKRDRAAATRRIAIDSTLDLHGLTQAEAHRLLPRFLQRAVDDDARLILVITGKGRKSPSGVRGGVLRAQFLNWIEEAPLRALIARVAPAKPKDGGEGAFYVFLKRKGAGKTPRP